MEPVISGIQQVGIGVTDVDGARAWYRRVLGFDVPIFDDEGVADRMQRYTGGQPQNRHAVLAVNLQGGGGLEIWQYTTRTPMPPLFQIKAGDLGVYLLRLKTRDIAAAFNHIKTSKADVLGYVDTTPEGVKAFHISDPYGNLIRIEQHPGAFMDTPSPVGGVLGAVVGVTDIGRSIGFYRDILGYDTVLYDETGVFGDLSPCPAARSGSAASCSAAPGRATARFRVFWARRRSSCCKRSTVRRTRS